MADKQNTQSILENIRKKIQKFEKPRTPEAKLSTTSMGDEFEYISSSSSEKNPSSKDAAQNATAASQAQISQKTKQSDDHAALEKELEDSFSDFLNKTTVADKVEPAKPVTTKASPINEELDFDIFDENNFSSPFSAFNNPAPKVDSFVKPPVPAAIDAIKDSKSEDPRLDFDALDKQDDFLDEKPIATNAIDEILAAPVKSEAVKPNLIDPKPVADSRFDSKPAVETDKVSQSPVNKAPEVKFDIEIDPKKLPQNNSATAKPATSNSDLADFPDDDFLNDKIEKDFANMALDKNSTNLSNVKKDFVPTQTVDKTLTKAPLNTSIHDEHADDFLDIEKVEEAHAISVTSEEMNKVNELSELFNDKLVDSKPKTEQKAPAYSAYNFEYGAKKPETKANQNFDLKSSSNSRQTLDAVDSMIDKKAAEKVTSSIKKLVEAKSEALDVASLTKSDKFNDVSTQLLNEKIEKWLNDNLPDLVERIVREEIKKIIHK